MTPAYRRQARQRSYLDPTARFFARLSARVFTLPPAASYCCSFPESTTVPDGTDPRREGHHRRQTHQSSARPQALTASAGGGG